MTAATPAGSPLSPCGRAAVLAAAFLGLVFDGFELGLMPVASLSVTKSLMGEAFTPAAGGDWFARYTAALMLGAAIGGVVLGRFGDRFGRSRGLGASILLYSLGAAAGGFVTSQWQLLGLRFLVGLGVGGVWPNGIALVAESWPAASKATVSGVMAAGVGDSSGMIQQRRGPRPAGSYTVSGAIQSVNGDTVTVTVGRERFEILVPEETDLVVRSQNVTLASEGDEVEVEGKYFQIGQLMVTSLKIMMSKPLVPPPAKGRRPAAAN